MSVRRRGAMGGKERDNGRKRGLSMCVLCVSEKALGKKKSLEIVVER
jgi:hypothetical protein